MCVLPQHRFNVLYVQLIYQVDELWESMCQSAVRLISSALKEVENAEMLLKIKGVIALFIQTMDV